MKKSTFLAISVIAATLIGCNNSSEADEGFYCAWDGTTYVNQDNYDQNCVLNGKYCEKTKSTYYTIHNYNLYCDESSRPRSSSSTGVPTTGTKYCCEYAPDNCFESLGLKNVYCPPQPASSESNARPQTDYSKCSNNSCYTSLIHTAAGSSMGSAQVANQCGCHF